MKEILKALMLLVVATSAFGADISERNRITGVLEISSEVRKTNERMSLGVIVEVTAVTVTFLSPEELKDEKYIIWALPEDLGSEVFSSKIGKQFHFIAKEGAVARPKGAKMPTILKTHISSYLAIAPK